jgi:hypothetical protein
VKKKFDLKKNVAQPVEKLSRGQPGLPDGAHILIPKIVILVYYERHSGRSFLNGRIYIFDISLIVETCICNN